VLDLQTKKLVEKMLKGDRTALARLISLIEQEADEVPEIMELISPSITRKFRLGITGMAGAGKSTLIDKLAALYRKQGTTLGIIAIDPSSLVSGGAVLGDRIRMQTHYLDEGIFIRSMATRGCYGGLCKQVENTIKLLDAFGKEVIIIETTGVGQTETEISRIADVVVMVLIPGFGDSIQLMKAGLIEVADIIAINKSERDGAEILEQEIKDELVYSPNKDKQMVLKIQALNDIGVQELYQEIEKRRLNTKKEN
jgi:LAO/AO transport system kinase